MKFKTIDSLREQARKDGSPKYFTYFLEGVKTLEEAWDESEQGALIQAKDEAVMAWLETKKIELGVIYRDDLKPTTTTLAPTTTVAPASTTTTGVSESATTTTEQP